MKIHILSDLHLEFGPFELPDVGADVIVLAGDIHLGDKGLLWVIEKIPSTPVIYVLGNHEYYGKAYPKLLDRLKELSQGTNVHILENDEVTINDVRFLGCTLWTDFELFGNSIYAGYEALSNMTDYRKIRVSPKYSKLRPSDTQAIHKNSLDWLNERIFEGNISQSVIVTHHAPSIKSIPFQEMNEILSAAYVSSLDDLVANCGARLWIHGHVHNMVHYKLNKTQIICNPRGYVDEPTHGFDASFIIEV